MDLARRSGGSRMANQVASIRRRINGGKLRLADLGADLGVDLARRSGGSRMANQVASVRRRISGGRHRVADLVTESKSMSCVLFVDDVPSIQRQSFEYKFNMEDVNTVTKIPLLALS